MTQKCLKLRPYTLNRSLTGNTVSAVKKTNLILKLVSSSIIPYTKITPKAKPQIQLQPKKTSFEYKVGTYNHNHFNTLVVTPKTKKTRFVLQNIGYFLLKTLNLFNKSRGSIIKYKYRKILNSFVKHNQVKNTVFRRKSFIFFNSYLYETAPNVNTPQSHNKFLHTSILTLKHSLSQRLGTTKLLPNSKYTQNYLPEVKLGRIRFKPGYQRLWRNARSALKELIGLKLTYQKQFTKFLVGFYKKTSSSFFSRNELLFYKVAIYSRIVPDHNTLLLFFNSKMLYINGTVPTNYRVICAVNDFIQLLVSK